MNGSDLISKTEKGRDEITTRGHGLSARLRQILILIDGNKSVSFIVSSHPDSDECLRQLQELLSQGFITLEAGGAGVISSDDPTPSLNRDPRANPAPESIRLEKAKSYLIDFIKGTVEAGTEKIIDRIRGCTTRSELDSIIESCRKVVNNIAGQRKAEEFVANMNKILGEKE